MNNKYKFSKVDFKKLFKGGNATSVNEVEIDDETILSIFNDKKTLLQWLIGLKKEVATYNQSIERLDTKINNNASAILNLNNEVEYINYDIDSLNTDVEDINDSISNINTKIATIIYDSIPPIGTILLFNDNSFNPNNKWVGTTWERITNNRYLRIAENVENEQLIGGSNTHNHSAGDLYTMIESYWASGINNNIIYKRKVGVEKWISNRRVGSSSFANYEVADQNSGAEVGGNTDNAIIEPTYQKVFAWKRIS